MLLNFFALPVSGKNFVVVIDPGHGGKDNGAQGKRGIEKNINLAVSLLLGQYITEEHPDVKVVYTRTSDVFIGLDERAEIANKANANLFISIHSNAMTKNSSVKGAEVYILGVKNMDESLEVTQRENSVILYEENYKQKYEGFNPGSAESYIMFERMMNLYAEQSFKFASMVQQELVNTAKRGNQYVKQAGYLVLRKAAMPRILIELDYLSNVDAEDYLMSSYGQKDLARAICNAFTKYKKEIDRMEKGSTNAKPEQAAKSSEKQSSSSKDALLNLPKNSDTSKKLNPPKISVSAKKQETAKKPETTKSSGLPKKSDAPVHSGRIYKIQILSTIKKLPDNAPELKGYKVAYYVDGKYYKYTHGESSDSAEINNLRKKIAKDFKDAFVIAFENGVKVPIN